MSGFADTEPGMRKLQRSLGCLAILALIGGVGAATANGSGARESPQLRKIVPAFRHAAARRQALTKVKVRCAPKGAHRRRSHRNYTCRYRGRRKKILATPGRCKGAGRAWLRSGGRVGTRIGAATCSDPQGPPPTIGLNEDWSAMPDQLGAARAAGTQVIRLALPWSQVEPKQGTYDWGPSDASYRAVLEEGMKPLFVLIGAPPWATGGDTSCQFSACAHPPAPQHLDRWKAFAAAAANRYQRVVGFEIWNEPNSAQFWAPTPDPAAYARLLEAAHAGIKGASPQTPVLFGGLVAPRVTAPQVIDSVPFMQAAYAAGAGSSADVLAAHPYPLPSPTWELSMFVQLALIHDAAKALGDGTKPIWITEVGISNTGDAVQAASEAEQANALPGLYRTAWAAGIGEFIWNRWRDPQTETSDPWEAGMGLLRADGSAKPYFCVYSHLRLVDPPCPDSVQVKPGTQPEPGGLMGLPSLGIGVLGL